MAELIQSVTAGSFPFPRSMRREVKEARKQEKTEFARWLGNRPVNANEADAPFAPLLSLEDELMLAKLREIAQPFPPANAYAQNALVALQEEESATADENGQYALPFMADFHVDEHI